MEKDDNNKTASPLRQLLKNINWVDLLHEAIKLARESNKFLFITDEKLLSEIESKTIESLDKTYPNHDPSAVKIAGHLAYYIYAYGLVNLKKEDNTPNNVQSIRTHANFYVAIVVIMMICQHEYGNLVDKNSKVFDLSQEVLHDWKNMMIFSQKNIIFEEDHRDIFNPHAFTMIIAAYLDGKFPGLFRKT
ncbi:MAG: hypothetical protein QM537_03645 [Candidatus Symbiobacter sp.]|nr:hypothetical protein [Candidatus Symbiobacter sp.]